MDEMGLVSKNFYHSFLANQPIYAHHHEKLYPIMPGIEEKRVEWKNMSGSLHCLIWF
jgi:hypothetical protein